jgi:hypothetical protein
MSGVVGEGDLHPGVVEMQARDRDLDDATTRASVCDGERPQLGTPVPIIGMKPGNAVRVSVFATVRSSSIGVLVAIATVPPGAVPLTHAWSVVSHGGAPG